MDAIRTGEGIMSLEWVTTSSDLRYRLVDTENGDGTVARLQRGLGCWYTTVVISNGPYLEKTFYGTEEEAKAWLLAMARMR